MGRTAGPITPGSPFANGGKSLRNAILAAIILGGVAFVPGATAKGYDGGFTLRYSFNSPYGEGVQTFSITDFEIRSGAVSGWQGRAHGEVDQWGGVEFTGPCPQNNAADTATWTGVFDSETFATGTYRCAGSAGGSWSMTRTSGGWDFPIPMEALIFLAIAVPLSVGFVFAVNQAKKRSRTQGSMGRLPKQPPVMRSKPAHDRHWEFLTSDPAPPPQAGTLQAAAPAGFPAAGSGAQPLVTGLAQVGVPNQPPAVAAVGWQGWGVTRQVAWQPPDLGPYPGYALVGYRIIELRYLAGSTQPVESVVANLGPGVTSWTAPPQTNWFRTAGDIVGYRVQPVLRDPSGATVLGTVTTVLPW